MKVMGLDPALASIGWATLFWDDQGVDLLEYDTLETPPKTTEGSRLVIIRRWLETFLEVRQPNLVVVERPSFFLGGGRGFKGAGAGVAANALPLGMAYGVILEACERAGVRVVEIGPSQVKKWGAGKGRASKADVRAAIKARFGAGLKGKDDGFDAVCVALAHIEMTEHDRKEVARVR
jgi:crossover junction endodeoxyribonuclease RuvC